MRSLMTFVLATGAQFCLSTDLGAQTITQEEFLEQLKRAHPLLLKERMSADAEREAQRGLQGSEDWYLFSRFGFSHEEPALSFAGPTRTNALSLSAGAQRAVWSTGGTVSISFESSTASILPTFGFSMPLYQNMIAASYVHPLLKNSGGSLDRLHYDLKRFDVDISGLVADENIEQFLAQSATLFLTWAFLAEQETIVSERLKLSEEERDRTLGKRRANLVDQADVMRAEDAVRTWKQQQVLVRSQVSALRGQLAVLAQMKDLSDRTPSFDLYAISEVPPLDVAIAQLKAQSRVLKVLHQRKQQLASGREGYQETLKPELSAFARVNTKRLDEGLGRSMLMDRPDASVGLQFSIPVGNTTAEANIARSDIQIAQVEKQMEESSISLTSALTNLHIRLNELKEILVLNQEQIESARNRTKEELDLYNQGRGELTFVILSRDNEQNARMTRAQNAFVYHTLRIEYRALMDEVYAREEH